MDDASFATFLWRNPEQAEWREVWDRADNQTCTRCRLGTLWIGHDRDGVDYNYTAMASAIPNATEKPMENLVWAPGGVSRARVDPIAGFDGQQRSCVCLADLFMLE